MELRHIQRGTQLQIFEMSAVGDASEEYEAVYHDLHDLVNETSFIVQCAKMNRNFPQLDNKTTLSINFTSGQSIHSFTGRAVGKMSGDLVVLEQLTNIMTVNRRVYERDEIRIDVNMYTLSEDMLSQTKFVKPIADPVLMDVSFDISAGGMCIITNRSISEENDPYYLAIFSVGERDSFMLPAKLVRRSRYARTRIGKYDYGFQFIFDNMPDEKSRLTKAILNRKLSFFSR